jgi:hypothetical protein
MGCSVAETQLFTGQCWVFISFQPSLPRQATFAERRKELYESMARKSEMTPTTLIHPFNPDKT